MCLFVYLNFQQFYQHYFLFPVLLDLIKSANQRKYLMIWINVILNI